MRIHASILRGLGLCLSAVGLALILYAATAFLLPAHPRQAPPSLRVAAPERPVRIHIVVPAPRTVRPAPVAASAARPPRVVRPAATRVPAASVLPVGSAAAPPPPTPARRGGDRTLEGKGRGMLGGPTRSMPPETPEAPPPPAPSAALP